MGLFVYFNREKNITFSLENTCMLEYMCIFLWSHDWDQLVLDISILNKCAGNQEFFIIFLTDTLDCN